MFYKKINLRSDKEMFNFLKNHFQYWTMNSWNGLKSIANCVKVYRLQLDGDCWKALDLLQCYDNSIEIDDMIDEWKWKHKNYEVFFNGRSGGYLVLYNKNNNINVLPQFITDNDTYEDYKKECREWYGSMKAVRSDLIYYTQLVQDFDALCDELRDYTNELSKE